MQVTLEAMIGFGLTIMLALIGAFWGLLSMLFKQSQVQIAEKFTGLEKSTSEKFLQLENSTSNKFEELEKSTDQKFEALEDLAKEQSRIEKEFLIFQRDLPLHYVRREDYVRNQTVIESKLDGLALKLENWALKGVGK